MANIRKEEAMETPVSSMIDVVFLLIIFFVVTAAVDDDIIDTSITLAQAKNVSAVVKKDPLTFNINIGKKGKINIIPNQPISALELKNTLIGERNKLGNSFPVVIRGDQETLFKYVDKVMSVIAGAGLYKVSISAISEK